MSSTELGREQSQVNSNSALLSRDVNDALWRGHGGWEIALTPVLFGGFGWLLDGWLNTRPVFVVVLAIVGLAGSVANQYYQYRYRMEVASVERREALEAPDRREPTTRKVSTRGAKFE